MDDLTLRASGPASPLSELWSVRLAPAVRREWARYGARIQWLVIAFMALAAGGRLVKGYYRLLWDQRYTGAVDLKLLHNTAQVWAARGPVYSGPQWVHPPATYALSWLNYGWLDVNPARWWWALTSTLALGLLALLAVRETGVQSRRDRLFLILMILAVSGTGITIGNGQLGLHCLLASLVGLLLIVRRNSWLTDLAGAALLVYALIKPTISAPFLCVALFAPRRLRPAVLVGLGYAGLTLFTASYLHKDLLELLRAWVANLPNLVARHGNTNLNNWLVGLGLDAWLLPASFTVFAALALWVGAHRQADFWVLVGISALVARLWTYHSVYDDVLIILPLIAAYRLARAGPAGANRDVAAGLFFAAALAVSLAPARMINLPWPWNLPYEAALVTVWLALMIFLAWTARRPGATY